MDKTINITLSGLIFNFTEDAYEKLKAYLNRLSAHLKDQEGAEEIKDDIENRIAELCNEVISNEKREVIYLKDIEEILSQLGDPDEFIETDDDTFTKEEKSTSTDEPGLSKRVFRDKDNAMLGGVCSGIAAYFNIDPIILRGIFVVMFFGFGTGFLLYLVLWIIIPKAVTASDRLRMRGESVNLKNIKSNFDKKKDKNSTMSKVGDFLTDLVQNFAKVLGPIIGVGMIIVALTGIISLLVATFANMGIWIDQDLGSVGSLVGVMDLVFESGTDAFLSIIAFFLLCITPLVFMTTIGVQILFKVRKNIKTIYLSLGILWVLGIGLAVYSGVTIGRYFRMSNGVAKTHTITTNSDTLHIHADFKPFFNTPEDVEMDLPFFTEENDIYFFYPDFNIMPTEDSIPKLKVKYSSHAKTNKIAENNSREIEYNYTLDNNKITLDGYYHFPKEQRLRDQDVAITLYLPKGKSVYLDPSVKEMIEDIKNEQDIYDEDMINRYWKMTSTGLTCQNCTGEESVVGKKRHSRH